VTHFATATAGRRRYFAGTLSFRCL